MILMGIGLESSAGRRFPYASLLLGLAAVGIFFMPGWTEALQYDRAAIAAGQLWRILTGHFTHYGMSHLFWDLIGFVGLAIFCEIWNRRAMLCVLLSAALFISSGNWLLIDQMQIYRGLSGLDSSLFGMIIGVMARRAIRRRRVRGSLLPLLACGLFTMLFASKIGYEMIFTRAIFTPGEGTLIPLAHLVGFVCGLAGGWFGRIWKEQMRRRAAPLELPRTTYISPNEKTPC